MRGVGVVLAGVIIAIFGTVFYLQGRGDVGPQSSFMYANPQWIDYGLYIALAGLAVAVLGGVMVRRRRAS